jgi:hypothetical protein
MALPHKTLNPLWRSPSRRLKEPDSRLQGPEFEKAYFDRVPKIEVWQDAS